MHTINLVETCRIGPPPGSVPNTSFPITLFDVIYLRMPPVQRLFLYQFPANVTTTHFMNVLLPKLKTSLSLSLQFFFPFAGNLTISPISGEHEITYVDGDSVSLTISESNADLQRLATNHPRDVTEFQPLLPQLPNSDSQKSPLLALQITVFPDSGISIGFTVNHVIADGSSSIHFVKFWASIFQSGDDSSIVPHPIHDRSLLAHLDGLKRLLLDQIAHVSIGCSTSERSKPQDAEVLATFVMKRPDIEALRKWVLSDRNGDGQKPFHCSAFVLTAAYTCVCLVRSRKDDVDEKAIHFGFPMDCRVRLGPAIPATYFGNCVAFCMTHLKVSDLKAEDGVRYASEAIGREIEHAFDRGVLHGADNWIPAWVAVVAAGERFVSVASSPKFRVYETDFGLGKPRKVEVTSIAGAGAISLAESRDEEGGIEVGIALPLDEMARFSSSFEKGLKHLSQ